MKKILIGSLFAALIIQPSFAGLKYKSIGIKGVYNHSSIIGTFTEGAIEQDQDPITTWSAGLYAVFSLRENLFLQPELLYSGRGFDEYRNIVTCAAIPFYWHHLYEYIDLPVLLKYRYYSIADKIFPTILAGPCVSYFNKYYLQGYGGPGPDDSKKVDADQMNRFELSAIIGLGVDYKQVVIDLRYQRSFTDNLKYQYRDVKNEVWSLMFGINL